jgi:hypothetical protein
MTVEKLYQIISALENIDEKEWEGLKEYMDYKMNAIGKIKNNQLTFDTLKTFFIDMDLLN